MMSKVLLEKKHFCIMPWIHLHVSQSGRVSPCCNSNRYLGNVKASKIQDIWHGDAFQKVREQFRNDIPDKRCIHCYNIERSGKKSLRQLTNHKYRAYMGLVDRKEAKPIYWDIRFSNICNFKCKTCWHGNSSAWFEEGSRKNASNERVIKAFTNSFEELMIFIDEVEEIYFAGGEPLIMEEHYRLLEVLQSRKRYDVKLRYTTNFSTLNFKGRSIFAIWRRFSDVHISASVDAAFRLGEEIREGFKWDQFLENRKRMLKDIPNVFFEITPTVSTLNVKVIPKLHRYLVERNLLEIEHIYLNILERPKEFNLLSLSEKCKDEVIILWKKHIEWLTQVKAPKRTKAEFETVISYLGLTEVSEMAFKSGM